MLMLAFNTTDDHGGAAIYRDTSCLAAAANESPASYSITLFRMVDDLLRRAGLGLGDIEVFAVAHGPGSFTGIRVGIAAAQAWGTAFSRPVRGVSVLEAIVEEAQPDTQLAASILDARRGEFFLGLFECTDSSGIFMPLSEALLLKRDAAGRFLQRAAGAADAARTLTCITRAHDVVAQTLGSTLPHFPWRSVPGSLVRGIARVALRAQQQGKLQSPSELDAYYIRRTDADMKWQE